MGIRTKTNDSTVGPGPAFYDVSGTSVRGRPTSRVTSLGIKPQPLKQFSTPAPGQYDVLRATDKKGGGRGFTFGHANLNFKQASTPGEERM